MEIVFNLKKLKVENASPVKYFLPVEQEILANDFIGKYLKINFLDEINCVKCGRKTNKTYGEGFCYHCFLTAPEADTCIVRPELCRAHEGISRDMEWSKQNCLTEHYVYLAVTDHVKIGVTRKNQIPARWIDQGALKVIKVAKTPYRQLAGEIEVDLKRFYSDKTNWQKMLKNEIEDVDLKEEKKRAAMLLSPYLRRYLDPDPTILTFTYPLLEVPKNVVSLSLDKTPVIEGVLTGIKGQYLIFDNEKVFNVRRFTGYKVKLQVE